MTRPVGTQPPRRRASAWDATCTVAHNCELCNRMWPTCAWCGSLGKCLSTSNEVRKLGNSSRNVVYSTNEYMKSYGPRFLQPSGESTASDSRCGLWVLVPRACSWVQDYCNQFKTTTCGGCKALNGCGFCTGDNGLAGRCIAGSASSSLSMSSSREICSDGSSVQPTAAGGSPVGRGTWIFGNWTAYYQHGRWDGRCTEKCRSHQVTRATASRGKLSLGHIGTGVSYAPGSNCTWLIWPTPWPTRTRMEVQLTFSALAARGDILWLHHAVWAGAAFGRGDAIGYAGCPAEISRRCYMNFRATVSAPVVVTFYSGHPSPSSAPTVATWIVDWALEWTSSGSQGIRPAGSRTITSREGSGLSSFIWIAMASMLLMPLLATLLCMGWRWRRSSPGVRHGVSISSAVDSRRQQAVDIEALERELPSCRPRVVGSNEVCEVEEGSTNLCSVCLAGFEAGDEVRSLPCTHNFHRSCIDVWLTRSGMCPLCRRPVLPHLPPVPASSSRSPRVIGASSMASRPFTAQLRGSTARNASARPPTGGGVVRPSSIGSASRGVNDHGHHIVTSAPAAGAADRAQVSARARVPAAGATIVGMRADEDSDDFVVEI